METAVAVDQPDVTVDEPDVAGPRIAAIVRDIARGGLAGLIVGILLGGIGGRLVMRLAALLVPEAVGLPTENGNRIGDITMGGTLALVFFASLLVAVAVGVTWVVISPWLPGRGVVKGLVAAPIAVVLGSFALINGRNPDFIILGHDPLVVGSLLVLVAAAAPAVAIVDAWLDRRLPRITTVSTGAGVVYLAFAGLGALVAGLPILQGALSPNGAQPLSVTIVLVGVVTLAWWRARLGGRESPSALLRGLAWAALLGGCLFGAVRLLPELRGALGIA